MPSRFSITRRRALAFAFALALAAWAGCGGGGGGSGGADATAGDDGGAALEDGGRTNQEGSSLSDGATVGSDGAPTSDGAASDAPASLTTQPTGTHFLDAGALLGSVEDPQWFLDNIPFLDVPDPQIQAVYYYRWETYKEHLVYTGPEYGYLSNEFLEPVSYGAPYGGVVAAAGHQITEGRWLHDQRYAKDDIEYWLNGPGQFPKPQNDGVNATTTDWAHEYSFWAGTAVWQQYLAAGDVAFTSAQQPALVRQYQGWQGQYDGALGLYWQVPVWDATEYSASSYESSDPYHGGAGYRPTINAYQYGDARAIAAIASLQGDTATASTYTSLATAIQTNAQKYLWDPTRDFFYDMPVEADASTALLDTREEMGFVPWMFEMPLASDSVAFESLLDPQGFAAPFGPTTVERRSQWFMYQAASCCHWDGPSWPYETSQMLTGLANLLDDYPPQTTITASDYVNALHAYAATQYKNGTPYVAEAHFPDDAGWIYDTPYHSEDYNHSTFCDNVIAGLIGIRGQPGSTLVVQPLAPATWDYFALENVLYHGHWVTVLWDKSGTRYGQGTGLHVYVDGVLAATHGDLTAATVSVGAPVPESNVLAGIDVASNGQKTSYGPQPTASYTFTSDNAWNAVDGLVFRVGIPEDTRWTSYQSPNASDSFEVNFQRAITTDYISIVFYDDGDGVRVPASFDVQYLANGAWTSIPGQTRTPSAPAGNAPTEVYFAPVTTSAIQIVAPNVSSSVGWGLSEVRVRSKPVFNVVNVNSNLLLAVQNESQDAGGQAQQYHSAGSLDQFWELAPAPGGYYKLVDVNSGLVLAPAGSSTSDSALVQQVADSTSPFTFWSLLDESANGQFKVKNEGSGLLLGVTGESTADSANVVQFEDNGTPDHLWMLEAAAYPLFSYDDFGSGASAWTAASGTWSICAPATAAAGAQEYCATTAGTSLALTGSATLRDYTVDALVRIPAPANGASAGIVVRASDATHYYVAEIGLAQNGIQQWDIAKTAGATRTPLASGAFAWTDSAPVAGGQVALRLSAVGGTISLGIVTASGAVRTLGSAYDTDLPSGQAGLLSNGQPCSFDGVRVSGG